MKNVSSTGTIPLQIEELTPLPPHLRGEHDEVNLLRYGQNVVLLARREAQLLGAIRCALRVDPWRRHGLIADLQVDEACRDQGVEERLITAAEDRLRVAGVTKIDAIIRDGKGWAPYFYRTGYWASRKTVLMQWDLTRLEPPTNTSGAHIAMIDRPDVGEISRLILASYQPYWRPWREHRDDLRWERVEFPADTPPLESAELEREMQARVAGWVAAIRADPAHALFVAYRDGVPVGLCDAIRRAEGDQLQFGVVMLREHGGRGLGTALLGHALHWLRDGGLTTARITTTSGLDDYDPTVYLYNLAYHAQITAEFINLVKHRVQTLPLPRSSWNQAEAGGSRDGVHRTGP